MKRTAEMGMPPGWDCRAGKQAVRNSVWSGEKWPLSGSGDLVGNTPDQPVSVSLELGSGPKILTKAYFTANPKFPYLSGQLTKNKVIVPQVCLEIYTWSRSTKYIMSTQSSGRGPSPFWGICNKTWLDQLREFLWAVTDQVLSQSQE